MLGYILFCKVQSNILSFADTLQSSLRMCEAYGILWAYFSHSQHSRNHFNVLVNALLRAHPR